MHELALPTVMASELIIRASAGLCGGMCTDLAGRSDLRRAPHGFIAKDHMIFRNEIFDACKAGAGVMYTARGWTSRATVISDSHIHDIPFNVALGRPHPFIGTTKATASPCALHTRYLDLANILAVEPCMPKYNLPAPNLMLRNAIFRTDKRAESGIKIGRRASVCGL